MASATITSPGASVGSNFTVTGTAPGCTNVTVTVTTANGTTTHPVNVLNGNYSVDIAGVPSGAVTIRAYCTAQGPDTAATVTCTADDS